jgi:PEP-CTERM motif
MKRQACLVTLCACLLLTGALASGQTIYDNGPPGYGIDAWTINEGFVVSDSFTVSSGTSQMNGLVFEGWVFPGDILESVEISITSQEFGGTTYFDHQVNFTASDCGGNDFGFNVCVETGSFSGPTLGNGTYWLNLQNAVVNTGDPVYWDENSGYNCNSPGCPSQASENSIGSIPSESFTVLGSPTSGGGSVPEPGSLLLFAGALLSGAGMMYRKIR